MSFLNSLFAKSRGGSVLGIDIGSSSLKVVQLRKEGGKAILETYGELALGPYDKKEVGQATNLEPEQIAETLKDLIRESKVTTKNCGVSIPFARSLLSLAKLPYRKSTKEQKTIIELEARKYIPVPISEVQLDWFIVPKVGPTEKEEEQNNIEVLIVAVPNNELSLLQKIIIKAGLSSSFYEIEIFSTIRAVVEEPVKPVMVIDIGAASTKAYIIEHGVVALSHSISAGSQDITQSISTSRGISIARAEALKKENGFAGDVRDVHELIFSRIFSEAHRVLTQYETSHNKSVIAVVLTGGGGTSKGLSAYAQKIFSLDTRVANPFVKTEAPEFMRSVLEEIGPEFAVAVGIALRKLDEV